MHLEAIRAFCLSRKGTISEEFPFGEDVLVFKARGKIFLLCRLSAIPLSINLKCDPERAIELRERYAAVTPGYHMNKRHWNTVMLDGSIPDHVVRSMIDHSFELVAGKRPGSQEP